jgi:outer membrane protein TolC
MKITLKSLPIILFTIIIATSTAVIAQDDTLNLNNAITISLQNNNRYKISQEKVHEKSLKINEVWGELWPQFSSDASATRWVADKGTLTGSDGQYTIDIVKGTIAINPGDFYNKLKASREDYIISVNDERKVKSDTIVKTIQLYYGVLLEQEMVKFRIDSLRALEENLHVVETGYKNGMYTQLVFLRAKVAAANETTRLINARKDYEQTKSAFNIQLGQETDMPVNLDTSPLHLTGDVDNNLFTVNDAELMNHYDEFINIAVKNRPELLQLNHLKNFYQYKEMQNDSVYLWPTFFVNGTYGATELINPKGDVDTGMGDTTNFIVNSFNSEINYKGWNKNWNITVGAVYRWGTLSPVDATRSKSDEFKSLTQQTDLELEDFIKSLKLEIKDGLLGLVAASHAIQSQRDNIASAKESVRVAVLQFKNGMIDNTELLNANVELSNATTMYIQSLYDFQVSKAKLNRALGYDYFSF